MKKINYLFFYLFLSVALLASCKSDDGGGDGPTAEEAAVARLQGTWDLTEAMRDQSNITQDYGDMTVVIANKTITTPGAPAESLFPTGTFTFVGDNYNQIVVDGITVTLTVTDTNLVTAFSLNAEGNNASRVAVVAGNYRFSFTKVQ